MKQASAYVPEGGVLVLVDGSTVVSVAADRTAYAWTYLRCCILSIACDRAAALFRTSVPAYHFVFVVSFWFCYLSFLPTL